MQFYACLIFAIVYGSTLLPPTIAERARGEWLGGPLDKGIKGVVNFEDVSGGVRIYGQFDAGFTSANKNVYSFVIKDHVPKDGPVIKDVTKEFQSVIRLTKDQGIAPFSVVVSGLSVKDCANFILLIRYNGKKVSQCNILPVE